MKFDGWPCNTIGHLFYATSSFVHHFVAIGEFKLQLQSGNAQSGSNSTIFRGGDLEIWRMTLKNNRAPLLCFFKLCAAFCTHWWIQTGHLFYASSNLRDLIAATGLVISNWIQIVNFSARVSVKFDGWPCNTIGHLFYATSSFVHHFVAIGEFKLQL